MYLGHYDWLVTSQIVLLISITFLVIFWRRALPKSNIFVGIPFSICLSLSIFKSTNLISLIFMIEILLAMSKIIFSKSYKIFDRSIFEFIRIPFWGITLFCYYQTFNTFAFVQVIDKAGTELSFVYINFLFLISILTIGQIYRTQNLKKGIVESISMQAIVVPIICLKVLSLLAKWGELLLPEHKSIIDLIIAGICICALFISIRFLKHTDQQMLKASIYSLVIVSLFPLLIYINVDFWEKLDFYSLKIVFLFLIFEAISRLREPGRFTIIGVFIILCELTGFTPSGHLLNYFNDILDRQAQLLSILSLGSVILAISFVLRSILRINRESV